MPFSGPKLLYQGSALLYLLSVIGHLKIGGTVVSSGLKPLGASKGAAMAKVEWMAGSGYLFACGAMIHKFSYMQADQFTANDNFFILAVWMANVYVGWSFAQLGHKPGVLVAFLRSSLLIAARLGQILL